MGGVIVIFLDPGVTSCILFFVWLKLDMGERSWTFKVM